MIFSIMCKNVKAEYIQNRSSKVVTYCRVVNYAKLFCQTFSQYQFNLISSAFSLLLAKPIHRKSFSLSNLSTQTNVFREKKVHMPKDAILGCSILFKSSLNCFLLSRLMMILNGAKLWYRACEKPQKTTSNWNFKIQRIKRFRFQSDYYHNKIQYQCD